MPEHFTETEIIDETPEEKLQRFKDELTLDYEHGEGQREAAAEDMRFANVDGGMWEDFYDDRFSNRVRLQLDMISDFKNRQYGEWTLNRVDVDFRPTDEAATDKDAKNLGDFFRADFRDRSGRISVDNAVLENFNCGQGAVKVGTVMADESDPANDFQDIEFRPKHEAFKTIIWHEAAQRIDKQDALRCVELIPFTKQGFEAKYPDKNPVSAYDPDTLNYHSWDSPDLIYVANRYDIVRRKETVYVYNNLNTDRQEFYWEADHEKVKDELAADDLIIFVEEKTIIRQTVEKSVFSGDELFVDSERIVGKFIPIAPLYGYYTVSEGIGCSKGLVRDLKDAARVLNMLVSLVAENAASGHSQIPVFTRDQIPNDLVKFWTDNSEGQPAYRLVDPQLDAENKPVNTGPVTILPAPQLDANVKELIQTTILYIRERTGAAPQETLDPKASGKAINAIIKRVNMNVQPIMDNINNFVRLLGDIYASMSEEVHIQKRVKATLSKDGSNGRLEIGQAVLDEETGTFVESNTFDGKRFKAYSDVGPAYSTVREEEVETLKGMADTVKGTSMEQDYLPAIFAEMVLASPGSNDSAVKKIARRSLLVKGLVEPETDEEKRTVQQSQSQKDPQAELMEAAAAQAEGEARERDSKVLVNIEDAKKKAAETDEIRSGIQNDKVRSFAELRKQAFEEANALPFGAN